MDVPVVATSQNAMTSECAALTQRPDLCVYVGSGARRTHSQRMRCNGHRHGAAPCQRKPETEQHLVVVCGLLNGEVKGTQLTVLYDRQREASLWSISSSSHRPYGQRPSNSFVNSSPNRMERRQHSADQISYKHDEVRAEFR